MATVSVWLASWEYECCGPQRKVGDQVSLDVIETEGRLSEARHQDTDDSPARTKNGQVVLETRVESSHILINSP